MSTATVEKYVAKRADLLAELVLTRREGARFIAFKDPQETGFLVQFPRSDKGGSIFLQPCIAVYVQGTNARLDDERLAAKITRESWKRLSEKSAGYFLGPVVFLLFSMEGDQGYFSWMLEPEVDNEKGPTLSYVESPEMTKITKKSIEDVFDRTEEWFKATALSVLRNKREK